MNRPEPGIYVGKVVHRRLRPVPHMLNYTVASVLVDVDKLDQLPSLLRHNRFGLFSLHDKDVGRRADPKPMSAFARAEMQKHGGYDVSQILMLSYPRILGYAFNPLTVFYGLDQDSNLRMLLYEVHNTFGGRHIYVAGPFEPGERAFATAEKVFRVSPFNKIEGRYGLKASFPAEQVAVGVTLSTVDGPLLNAYFKGARRPLTNRALLGVFLSFPLMTFKVMAGIHWEALKLWLKGLKLQAP